MVGRAITTGSSIDFDIQRGLDNHRGGYNFEGFKKSDLLRLFLMQNGQEYRRAVGRELGIPEIVSDIYSHKFGVVGFAGGLGIAMTGLYYLSNNFFNN